MTDGEYQGPWWTAEWDRRQLDKQYQRMLTIPGPAVQLELTRSDRRIAEDPNKTFSPESVDEVLSAMRAWFYSRLTRAYEEGTTPHKALITISVEVER